MRRLIFFFQISLLASSLAAQDNPAALRSVADQMPYFPGCSDLEDGSEEKRSCSDENLIVYIADYLEYPDSARENEVEGTVYIGFEVDREGHIKNPEIIRDIGVGCGTEALRIVASMPLWEPARHKGEPVGVRLTLPVVFSLENAEKNAAAEDFTLFWGSLKENHVTRQDLENNFEKEVIVRDEKGNPVEINELVFAYKRKRKTREAESRGNITRDMEKVACKARKGGEFAIIATIQDDGRFVDVSRIFQITGKK